jgi:hypothetical protein
MPKRQGRNRAPTIEKFRSRLAFHYVVEAIARGCLFAERWLVERGFKDGLAGGDDAEKVRAREGEFQCAVARS